MGKTAWLLLPNNLCNDLRNDPVRLSLLGHIIYGLTLTRCGASWRVSWKCGSVSRHVIQECFRTCSAVYRW